MIDILSPILSTGVGIFGAFLQRKHERNMFKHETERMRVEFEQELALTEMSMKAKREETEQEIALTEIAGNISAFTNSQDAENNLSKIRWGKSMLGDIANFMRSITRPGITWYLVLMTSIRTSEYYAITDKLTQDVTNLNDQVALIGTAFEQMLANPFDLALVNMTAMVVGWWFGSRGQNTSYEDEHYKRTS